MKKFLAAALAIALAAISLVFAFSCSNDLLNKVEDDIGTYKEGDILPAERKPVISHFEWNGVTTTTNNPAVNVDITATAEAVNDSGPATIAGYLLTESTATPALNDPAWTVGEPDHFDFPAVNGAHTLRLWVKDSFGNLSEPSSRGITLAPIGPAWADGLANGMVVTAHEVMTLNALEALSTDPADTPTILVDGSPSGTATGVIGGTGNATVTVSPGSALWPAGSPHTITVQATTFYGLALQAQITINAFNGVCVRESATPGDLGTRFDPFNNIQNGINEAVTRYGTGPAEVRVRAGNFSAACTTTTYIANIAPGISLKGGYDATFTSQTGGTTTLTDTSTSASGSSEGNPVRVVNASGSGITSTTIIDRLTIILGSGGVSSEAHCGFFCTSSASPSVAYITVQSTGVCPISIGFYINQSNIELSYCNINPGISSIRSVGIRMSGTGSQPRIENSTISGGGSASTPTVYALMLVSETQPEIVGNTIYGGEFVNNGYCIYISTSTPSIINNTFLSVNDSWKTIAINEADGLADPYSVSENRFNYSDGGTNYYIDENTTPGIGSTNFSSKQVVNGTSFYLSALGNTFTL